MTVALFIFGLSVVALATHVINNSSKKTLLVFLPAAGKRVWQELIPLFEKRYGVEVEAVYGSSGRLLQQAYVSERGDVLGSATPPYMNKAVEYGLVYPETVSYVACMRPAILVPKDVNVSGLDDLIKRGIRILMCDPEGCAVGKFFKYALAKEGLWEKISKKVVGYTENFSKLIAALLVGKAEAALGWDVAARWYPGKLKAVPLDLAGPYEPCIEVAVLKSTKNLGLAKLFVKFITSKEALEKCREYGYSPPR